MTACTRSRRPSSAWERGPADRPPPIRDCGLLDGLDGDRQLASQHRLLAVRGQLHEIAGDRAAARAAYLAAARRTTSLPQKR